MTVEIVQLGKEDFQDCIDFINMVFSMASGPTDFPRLLPAYYHPTDEHMRCHHVVREDGKIKALVGIYPGELAVGDQFLRVARIGAVSTHPYSRGKGYMRQLMNHCMNIVRRGFDVSHLGGLRHRYQYFGYEKCGYVPCFVLNENNLKHGQKPGPIVLSEITENQPSLMAELKKLHDRQPVHAARTIDNFYQFCRNWQHRLFAAFLSDRPVGYLVATEKMDHIVELVAENSDCAVDMAKVFLKESGMSSISVRLSPLDGETTRLLSAASEEAYIENCDNWQVIDWPKTIDAFLKIKHRATPLALGELVVEIAGQGRLKVGVSENCVTVQETTEAPDIKGSPSLIMRLLFGPTAPELVADIPPKAQILKAWCPLPLYLPRQDHS